MHIKSPISKKSNVKFVYNIKTKYIVDKWKGSDIDVSRIFQNLKEIFLYECLDTGYKFFYPFNLEGDDWFYQDLQKFDWYYFDWKWEYGKALEGIKPGEKVLEIGCGPGDFIAAAKVKGCDCTGLEFNEKAMEKSKNKGLAVFKETIQEHAKNNKNKYDIVVSFQVMEHIANIGEAIRASLDCLKPGGKLIISVPNHDSIINKSEKALLNMPPHHMGIWNKKSLSALPNYFPVIMDNTYTEPLQKYHFKQYYMEILGNNMHKIFGNLAYKLNVIPRRILFYLLENKGLNQLIKGHAIIGIYTKK